MHEWASQFEINFVHGDPLLIADQNLSVQCIFC